MTRKRFVKLCMSMGYSRNDANTEAREAVSRGVSYCSKYLYILCEKNGLVPLEWCVSVDDLVTRMKNMIYDMACIIAEAIPSICEAINAAIPQLIAEIERLREEAESETE